VEMQHNIGGNDREEQRGRGYRTALKCRLEVTGGLGGRRQGGKWYMCSFLICDMYAIIVKMYKQHTEKGMQKQSTQQRTERKKRRTTRACVQGKWVGGSLWICDVRCSEMEGRLPLFQWWCKYSFSTLI